jgi:hypothetical protein
MLEEVLESLRQVARGLRASGTADVDQLDIVDPAPTEFLDRPRADDIPRHLGKCPARSPATWSEDRIHARACEMLAVLVEEAVSFRDYLTERYESGEPAAAEGLGPARVPGDPSHCLGER